MNPVIECLKERYIWLADFQFYPLSSALKIQDLVELFTSFLAKEGEKYHSELYYDLYLLNVEYGILRQQLTAHLSNPLLDHKNPEYTNEIENIKQQLIAAVVLATMIEFINLHFLKPVCTKIQNEQQDYLFLLSEPEAYEGRKIPVLLPDFSITNQVRAITANVTWYRLFISRSKRLIELIALLKTGWQLYQDFADFLTEYATPVIAYVGWCFFIPRLLANTIKIGIRTLPFWLTDAEKKLSSWDRFRGQLMDCWTEIGNDFWWFLVGLFNWGVFTGILSPYAATLTLIFYGYDVVLASIRIVVELNRLTQLKNEYTYIKQCVLNSNNNPGEINEFQNQVDAIDDFLEFVVKRRQFERLRLGVNVLAAVFIFLGGGGALSIFSFMPVIALAGAITLVTVSLTLFAATRVIRRLQPKENPKDIKDFETLPTRLGFFSKGNMSQKPSEKNLVDIYDLPTPRSETKTDTPNDLPSNWEFEQTSLTFG